MTTGRLRVAVLTDYPNLPWYDDWESAARLAAGDSVRIARITSPTWPRVPDGPRWLHCDPERPDHYQLRIVRWRPSRFLGRLSDRVMARRFVRALRYVERQHGRIDVLHAHFFWLYYLPGVQRATGIPYVVTEHHTGWYGQEHDRHSPLGIARAKRLFEGAAAVIPVCGALEERIASYGIAARCTVIHNPVDAASLPDADADAGASADGGPRDGDTLDVVSVGRLTHAKGFDVLLRAFARARESEPRLRLTVFGDGVAAAGLATLRDALGLEGNVEFAGRRSREDIAKRLRESHVFAVASRIENLTVAVLEAWCMGVPVVVTDVGGHREVVTPSRGRIVPSEDADALAQALVEVARASAGGGYDRAAIAAGAREEFSIEAVAEQLRPVYEAAVHIVGEQARMDS